MKSIWQIDGTEVEALQGNSPDFIRIMNALLSAYGRSAGLKHADIVLNQDDTIPDGGVDAEFKTAIPAAIDKTGYCSVPTCWQFKAQPTSNIKPSNSAPDQKQETALREEINKPYAAELIQKGYGYRFCIADDMPANTKTKWEAWLSDEVKKINPAAPPACVITASDIAQWANHYPPIVIRFRPNNYHLKTYDSWQGEVRALTPEFIEPSSWPDVSVTIRSQIRFDQHVNSVLTVQGESGVGKTRMVCEALGNDHTVEALVAATSDEQKALDFAQAIANNPDTCAILVADECSLQFRERLQQILLGCSNRLRIVAIDNSLQREGRAGEIRLTRLTLDEVLKVLEKSFPDLPSDRRRSFAQLSNGFIRLAVDLCRHDHLLPKDGRLDVIFGFFQDSYLTSRLTAEQLVAVQLVSLLPRVGFRDDVANELKELCAHPVINRNPNQIVEIATSLKQSPGFIEFGGRFLSVTPQLIAQVAFQAAWSKWVAPDTAGFLRSLSPTIVDGFVEQARRAPNPELARAVSAFFLNWAKGLGPPDIAFEATAIRLVHLIETDPDIFLPILLELLNKIPAEELRTMHSSLEGQKARRQFVWLAEKLGHLPEYFHSAEQLLLNLALAESEHNLGNSATRIWTSLYRIAFSGTPIPFLDRLNLLERRIREAHGTQLSLVVKAFDEILMESPGMRLAGPPVVLGRVPPAPWRPVDIAENLNCRNEGLRVIARICSDASPVANALRSLVAERLSQLLLTGSFKEVKEILANGTISDSLLATITRELEDFTNVFCREKEVTVQRRKTNPDGSEETVIVKERYPRKVTQDLEAEIHEWYTNLIPETIHGRLVSVVGRDSWQQEISGDQNAWQVAMNSIATEFIANPSVFEKEISWLASSEARSDYHLGQSLGKLDHNGMLLEKVMAALRAGAVGVARGYFDQASALHPSLLERLNSALDQFQDEDPKKTFEVLWSASPPLRKIDRYFAMVDGGRAPVEYLRSLERDVYDGKIESDQFAAAINKTCEAAEAGNPKAGLAAIKLLYAKLHPDRKASAKDLLSKDNTILTLLRHGLIATRNAISLEPTFWMILAEDLAAVDPDSGIQLISQAMANRDYNSRQLAENHLIDVAVQYPSEVMEAVGKMLLNPTDRIWLQIGDISAILKVIPDTTIIDWISRHGLSAAQAISRHLPPPYFDENNPVVPPLTEYVLEKFEDDEKVFRDFVSGVHKGKIYSGDIAGEYLDQANAAKQFTGHRLKRIRDWAIKEIEDSRQQAAFWKQRMEEER